MSDETGARSTIRPALRVALTFGAGAAALMTAFSAPALAQAPAGEEAADTETTASAGETARERRLGAVVVEATRREGVTVQDVPVAVTAIDAQLLDEAGFRNAGDLEQLAPTVQITQTESAASGTNFSIRGIGTGSNNPGFEPAVGTVIDGVFRTRTGIALAELPELSSVEILRGPQGTLFGRNTSAGVISINTAGPQFDGSGAFSVSAGNFGAFAVEYTGNHAFNEDWAGRVDAKFRERDGYIDDVNSDRSFNSINRYFVRGQLAYEGDETQARFILDLAETDESCCVGVNLIAGPLAAAIDQGAAMAGNIGIRRADPSEREVAISPNRSYDEAVEEFGLSGQIDHAFDFGNFTSITAYRSWEALRDQDVDFSGIDRAYRDDYRVTDEVFTQEVRLQNEWNNVDWLVGAFYMQEDLDLTETIRFGTQADLYTDLVTAGATGAQFFGTLPFGFGPGGVPVGVPPILGVVTNPATGAPVINPATGTPIPIFVPETPPGAGQNNDEFSVETEAIALFTHNEITLSDPLTLTVGARYNHETKDINQSLNSIAPGCDFLAANPQAVQALQAAGAIALAGLVCNPAVNTEGNGTYSGDRSDEEVTGTVKLAYEFSPDLLTYASYSRGFKSGGYNLDRAAFDYALFGGDGPDIEDQEFQAETVDAFELGWKSTLMDGNVTFNGAVFYQDVKDFQENFFTGINFRTFNADVENYGVELDVGATPTDNLLLQGGFAWTKAEREEDIAVPDGTGGVDIIAEQGVQLTNVPEFVLTGAGTYTVALDNGFDLNLHANVRWNDEAYLTSAPEFREQTKNDAYALVGARVSLINSDVGYELSVFGGNLTDEDYNLSVFPVPEQTGNVSAYPGLPRFYGAELKFRW